MANNKTNFLNALEDYKNNGNKANDGYKGNLFEGCVKAYLGNFRGSMVSARGAVDTKKKLKTGVIASFEIKQGQGELGILDREGNIVSTCLTRDYMITCYKFNPDEPVEVQAYVLSMAEYVSMMNGLNLIGTKYSSQQYNNPNPYTRYHDRLCIKQMSTAKRTKVRNAFIDSYETLGMTLEDFCTEYLMR